MTFLRWYESEAANHWRDKEEESVLVYEDTQRFGVFFQNYNSVNNHYRIFLRLYPPYLWGGTRLLCSQMACSLVMRNFLSLPSCIQEKKRKTLYIKVDINRPTANVLLIWSHASGMALWMTMTVCLRMIRNHFGNFHLAPFSCKIWNTCKTHHIPSAVNCLYC